MISLAEVLEWKYGSFAGTKQKDPNDNNPNPEMVISSWNHPSIPKPDEAQIAEDFAEYEIFIAQKNQKKEATQQAIDDLKESIKDKKKSEITDQQAIDFIKLKMAQELELEL